MKTGTFGLALAVAGWMATVAASAFEISEELRLSIQRDIEAIEKDGAQMGEVMAALREVGASYLPELVAPIDVEKYQTPERRRLMTGVYLMDLTYAATFDQRAATARYGEAVYQLLDRLGFPQPDMERRYREALEQIDLPGGDARLRELAKEPGKDPVWQEMLRTGEGVDLVADELYGFLIEGMFQTAELCAISDYDPSFMMYVAYMRDSFQAYKQLLFRLGDNPELATSMDRQDRFNFLATMLVILGDLPDIGPEQLQSIRPVISKARQEIVQ